MLEHIRELPHGKAIYFASDFHLGVPDKKSSNEREKKIIEWLDMAKSDAEAIILAGDIFDFWFEYKKAIPRGFIRLQGKIAELTDSGIHVVFFTGNHDMWMFDYFPEELGVVTYRDPQTISLNGQKLLIGHGDGLGPGDWSYKILKKIFNNKICQWAFARIHPNLGIRIANYWSAKSRIVNSSEEDPFDESSDYLFNYCKAREMEEHFDFYIFGHRHIAIKTPISETSWFINLGEWVHKPHYARFDGKTVDLIPYI